MVDDRRTRVASYKVRGFSLAQTRAATERDGCVNPDTGRAWSIGQICEDLKFLRKKWERESTRDIGEWKKIELEKIDDIERKALEAWERGIGKKKKVTEEQSDKGGQRTRTETEEINGDPRYLAILLDCQMRRAKLIGLDEALKTETTGRGGGPIEITDTERVAKLEELLAKVTQRAALDSNADP